MSLGLEAITARADLSPPLAPAHFRPAGTITLAKRALGWNPSFGNRFPRKGVYRAGLAYEAKVKRWLKEERPNVELGPWFTFRSGLSPASRYCQPDALEMVEDTAHIYEIKLRWCPEAWWQILRLYAPVVLSATGARRVTATVICRAFDPAVSVPDPQATIIEALGDRAPDNLSVMIWRPECFPT